MMTPQEQFTAWAAAGLLWVENGEYVGLDKDGVQVKYAPVDFITGRSVEFVQWSLRNGFGPIKREEPTP